MKQHAMESGRKQPIFNAGRELLSGLIVVGWFYMAFQTLELGTRGSLGDAGPGMGLFDLVRQHVTSDPFGFLSAYSICTSPSLHWSATDFVKALAMWGAMVLAMMFPALAPMFRDDRSLEPRFRSVLFFVSGYLLAWLVFCCAAVGVQWVLRSQEYLDAQMVSASSLMSAAILILAGAFQLSEKKRWHLKVCRLGLERLSDEEGTPGGLAKHGSVYAGKCIQCYWPLMMTMFVFGLMNVVAMAALTLFMIHEKTASDMVRSVRVSGARADRCRRNRGSRLKLASGSGAGGHLQSGEQPDIDVC